MCNSRTQSLDVYDITGPRGEYFGEALVAQPLGMLTLKSLPAKDVLMDVPYIPGYMYSYPSSRPRHIEAHRKADSKLALAYIDSIIDVGSYGQFSFEASKAIDKRKAVVSECELALGGQISGGFHVPFTPIDIQASAYLKQSFSGSSSTTTSTSLREGLKFEYVSGKLADDSLTAFMYQVTGFFYRHPESKIFMLDWTVLLKGRAWTELRSGADPSFQLSYYDEMSTFGVYSNLCNEIHVEAIHEQTVRVKARIHNYSPLKCGSVTVVPYVRVFELKNEKSLEIDPKNLQKPLKSKIIDYIGPFGIADIEFEGLGVPKIDETQGWQVVLKISPDVLTVHDEELWNNLAYNTFPAFGDLPLRIPAN